MREHGGEPLVDQPHRARREPPGQRRGERPCIGSGPAFPAGKASRQPDDDLDRIVPGREPGHAVQVAAAPGDGGERAGEHAVRIAARDADPHGSDVNRKPHTAPQGQDPRAACISWATMWLRHGLTVRHQTPSPS